MAEVMSRVEVIRPPGVSSSMTRTAARAASASRTASTIISAEIGWTAAFTRALITRPPGFCGWAAARRGKRVRENSARIDILRTRVGMVLWSISAGLDEGPPDLLLHRPPLGIALVRRPLPDQLGRKQPVALPARDDMHVQMRHALA